MPYFVANLRSIISFAFLTFHYQLTATSCDPVVRVSCFPATYCTSTRLHGQRDTADNIAIVLSRFLSISDKNQILPYDARQHIYRNLRVSQDTYFIRHAATLSFCIITMYVCIFHGSVPLTVQNDFSLQTSTDVNSNDESWTHRGR